MGCIWVGLPGHSHSAWGTGAQLAPVVEQAVAVMHGGWAVLLKLAGWVDVRSRKMVPMGTSINKAEMNAKLAPIRA